MQRAAEQAALTVGQSLATTVSPPLTGQTQASPAPGAGFGPGTSHFADFVPLIVLPGWQALSCITQRALLLLATVLQSCSAGAMLLLLQFRGSTRSLMCVALSQKSPQVSMARMHVLSFPEIRRQPSTVGSFPSSSASMPNQIG
jgi:hypothetical protein